MRKVLLFSMLLCLGSSGCDMPQDQRGTLERVRGGTMNVGIVDNPPWATMDNGAVTGVEAALVQDLARELKADIHWVKGNYLTLAEALKAQQIDLLIGGLTMDVPSSSQLGLSTVYARTSTAVAVPPGTAVPAKLEGLTIAARRGDPAAAELPSSVQRQWTENRRGSGLPVLAQDWEIAAWGYIPTGFQIKRHRHVVAVPPGENAFLRRLDRFLKDRGRAVLQILEKGDG